MNLLHAHGSPTMFHTANGRHCDCLPCTSASQAYHAKNYQSRRAKRQEYHREQREAIPPEKRRALDHKRYEREQERRLDYQHAYYLEHRDEHIARARRRRASVIGSHTKADVVAQFERQKGRCYWCGMKLKGERGHLTWHVDHIVPIAKGGSDWPENIVCACAGCNHRKSDAHPMDYAGRMF